MEGASVTQIWSANSHLLSENLLQAFELQPSKGEATTRGLTRLRAGRKKTEKTYDSMLMLHPTSLTSLTPPLPPPPPQPSVQTGQHPICLVTKHYEPPVFARIVKKARGCRPPVCAGDQTKQMPKRHGSSPTNGEQTTRLRAAVLQGSQVQYERTYFKGPYSCMQGSCHPRALPRFVRTDHLWPRATELRRTPPPTTNTVFKIPHCSILMRYPLHDQQAAALTTYA